MVYRPYTLFVHCRLKPLNGNERRTHYVVEL